MNKSQLISKISKDAEISQAAAKRALDSFQKCVSEELKHDGEIQLVGFGRFSIRQRSARMGRNPKTGEEIKIEAANVPVFKAGKELKEFCN